MAAIVTENDGFFGSLGLSNPEAFVPGLVAIRRAVNFAASPVEASKSYEFMALPASFVVMGVLCRELGKCDASTTVALGLKSDSTALVAAAAVGGATLTTSYTTAQSVSRMSGDIVCLTPTAALTDGVFEVTVLGYLPNGDSKNNIVLDTPYKTTLQTQENVSGGDPYLALLGK